MGLRFDNPLWLLVAVLAIPLALLGLRWFRTMSRSRAWSGVLARSLLLVLLGMALAGASTVRTTERLATIALIDVSGSVRSFGEFGTVRTGGQQERVLSATEAIRAWLEQAAGERGEEDLLGLVAFDGESIALMAPRAGSARGESADVAEVTLDVRMAEGTNLAEAIRLGAALFPPDAGRRLVLISDGDETSGDALAAAREIAGAVEVGERAGTIPIDVLPVAYRAGREVLVEFVDAPPQAASESTVTVRVGLRATRATTGTLQLLREGEPVDLNGAEEGLGRRIAVEEGRSVELIELRLDERTIHRFEAVFEPDDPALDTLAANNRGEAFTVTPGRGVALLVDGVSNGDPSGAGATLGRALEASGIEVELVPPGGLPPDLLALHAYDLVILQNVPADEVPRPTQSALVEYVRELGGGLVMVGGPDSFGAGAWKGTPVADVLPVKLDLPEELVVPSAAIMIVLDSSGSMGQRVLGGSRTQQEIANESAALAIETLDAQDLVGVISFDNAHRTILPLTKASDAQAAVDRVRAISPGGGTNMFPALESAGRMLRGVEANTKHIIVLSDGRSSGSPREGEIIASRLSQDGISVSTIAVGDGADTDSLSRIAAQGGGQYHRVLDPYALPRIFIKAIRVVNRPLIRLSPFDPVVRPTGSPLTAGVPPQWPTLRGLVLTQPREEPTITYAAVTPSGEPLLAHWNVGLGQVGAFTSDAHEWAREWIGWPGYRQLWSQIARSIARPTAGRGQELITEVVGGELRIRMQTTTEDGRPIDLLSVPGLVYPPGGGEPRRIRLSQTGPGLYEGVAPAEGSGSYVVVLTPKRGATSLPPVVGGASRQVGEEFRRLRSNVGLLQRIAEATGGRVLSFDAPEDASLFDRSTLEPRKAATPLWRALVLWAVVVFLLDVGTRRVAWDRLITREVASDVRAHAAEALSRRSEAAAATLGRLRGTREAPAESRSEAFVRSERAQETPAPRSTGRNREPTEQERREAVRRALRATQGKPAGGDAPSQAGARQREEPSEDTGSSSLLAAKKRARERMERERGGGE